MMISIKGMSRISQGVMAFLLSLISWAGGAGQTTVPEKIALARVKYQGGGDWYNDPSCIPNLCRYMNENTRISLAEKEAQVALSDETLFQYPFLYLTGHGHIQINEDEALGLRRYLLNGGFLYADDDYGMDRDFRQAIRKVFPEREWVELPFSHWIYHCHFHFQSGLPKIHEHDGKPPQGFAILDDTGRMMIFYSYETNISDGWADPEVHQDPPEVRETALKMGANIVIWALMN